jgi:hypothetical protein
MRVGGLPNSRVGGDDAKVGNRSNGLGPYRWC